MRCVSVNLHGELWVTVPHQVHSVCQVHMVYREKCAEGNRKGSGLTLHRGAELG